MYDLNGYFHGDFAAGLVKKVQQLSQTTFAHKLHAPRIELSELLKSVLSSQPFFQILKKIYDCLPALIIYLYLNHVKVLEGHAAFSEKKGNSPKLLTQVNFRPRGLCPLASKLFIQVSWV